MSQKNYQKIDYWLKEINDVYLGFNFDASMYELLKEEQKDLIRHKYLII